MAEGGDSPSWSSWGLGFLFSPFFLLSSDFFYPYIRTMGLHPYDTKTVACGGKGGAGELIRFRQLERSGRAQVPEVLWDAGKVSHEDAAP